MKILNVHQRIIQAPKAKIAEILDTLSSDNDRAWPYEKWIRMKLDNGLQVGSKGGHGPVGYFVKDYQPGTSIEFEFTAPKGFEGIHKFEIKELAAQKTEVKHTIDMKAQGTAILSWTLVVRWLHDALIEDVFDKMENQFSHKNKVSKWPLWVRICRKFLTPK